MKRELKITEDNSHTLYVPELDEHYHSIHGAIQESEHVFINAGLQPLLPRKHVSVFELGFGTGLNAFLTFLAARNQCKVDYVGLEKYPISQELAAELNFAEGVLVNEQPIINALHSSEWERDIEISPEFTLCKVEDDISSFETEKRFDLVYFDAFAPDKQAEMWGADVFSKIFKLMKPEAVLTTYCAKGSVRRTLQELGLQVERLKGPPGKREMLRATKK